MKTRILISILCLSSVWAGPLGEQNMIDDIDRLEMKLETAMDELNKKNNIGILGDIVSLEKVPLEKSAEISHDPLVSKMELFFRSRKIHIKFPEDGSAVDYFGRALGEKNVDIELKGLTEGTSEARTKLKRVILPVLLALKLKALIVLPIVLTLIGLVGIKGLGAGLMALLLSGAVALKALLTSPPHYPARVSYGVVRPYDIHHEHWHRSQDEIAQPYRGWIPEYNDQYPYQEAPGFVS